MTGKIAVANYDFDGDENEHQLSFKKGDKLAVSTLEADSPWAYGELNGRSGWFPVDYVVIADGEEISHTASPPPTTTLPASSISQSSSHENKPNGGGGGDKVKASYDFHATADDEISFKENEIITVINRNGDWWTGIRGDGKEGLFPSTYVEPITLNNNATQQSETDNGHLSCVAQAQAAVAVAALKTTTENSFETDYLSSAITSSTLQQLEKQLSIDSATGLSKELPASQFSGMWNGGIPKPMWMSWAFIDIMTDPYCRKRENNGADMVALYASFDFVADAVRRMSESTSSSAHRKLHQALKQASGFASSLPAFSCSADRFHHYLSRWVNCITQLRSNEIAIGSVGWSNADGTGQCPVVVVHRTTAKDEYTLSIVNPEGEGSEYHPSSLNLKSGGTQRAQAIVFSGIPTWKLNNASFWFMALRRLIFPASSDSQKKKETGAQLMYERLLPYLNTRPLYSNAVASEAEGKRLNFQTQPLGGNPSKALSVLGAVEQALCLLGESEAEQKKTVLLFRMAIMHMATNELTNATSLRPADVVSLCHASRCLAREAADYAAQFPSCDAETLNEALLCSKNIKLKAQELDLAEMGRGGLADPVELPSEGLKNSTLHPLLGRLCRDGSVEHLAGEAVSPPIIRPVELTLVPDSVSSFEEVGTALYNASYVCTLLGNQRDCVKHTYLHRMALITHLFTRVIPIPMPISHPEARHHCFWQADGRLIRLETQTHILKRMELICRHFVAASLSLKVTRSLDTTRLLTMACMSAISDVVMRMEACDTPSMCSMHYSGQAAGPTHPFGFEMGYFAAESEAAKLPNPALQAVRCQVLDYFCEQRELMRDDHVLFSFEHTMGFGSGERIFLGNVCLQMGFPGFSDSDILPTYLSGEDPLILDFFPELGYFRDIVYLMKAMMVPTSSALPEVKRWTPQDARLRWKWKGEDKEKCFHVKGFGQTLECNAYTKEDIGADGPPRKAQSGNVFTRIKRRIMGGRRARAPHSYANPCYLVDKPVETEDDILHVRTLPDFGDRLRAHDSELLLQYLTAPYIRIPLVMQFFADPQHLLALGSTDLQEVLEAVLFEPGAWQSARQAPLPMEIPVLDRSHLSTPCGLLFNELLKSPHSLISSLDKMLDTALEMDTGRYTLAQAGCSSVILFVVRLCVRVEEFILYLHRPDTCAKVRGLENRPPGLLSYLGDAQMTMRKHLNKAVFPMIEQWLARAAKGDDVETACVLHAHLLFLFKNVSAEDLSLTVVGVLLTSQVWLMVHFRFEGETSTSDVGKRKATDTAEPTSGLFISSTDVFDLVAKHRNKIMDWLCSPSNASHCNVIMEGVVRVHTHTGGRTEAAGLDTAFMDRHWQSILRKDCRGRFVPDTEIVQVQLAEQEQGMGRAANMSFLDYMRLTTQAVDLEVNAQLGEFTLKKHSMETLPLEIEALADFQYVFGCSQSSGSAIGCAEVRHRAHRKWYRLVGHRHDVQLWDEDPRMHAPLTNFIRPYTSNLSGGEEWIAEILEPVRCKYLNSIELFLPSVGFGEPSNTYAVLAGYHVQQMTDVGIVDSHAALPVNDGGSPVENSTHATAVPVLKQLKEVVVLRNPGVIYVYDVVEHGRRYYRSLIFTSNVNLCIADIPPCGVMDEQDWRAQLVGGNAVAPITPPQPSLVITRNLYQHVGPQMFIPTRLLNGVLPAALLDQYVIWQNADDSLTGIPKYASKANQCTTAAVAGSEESSAMRADILESLDAAVGTHQQGTSILRVYLFQEQSTGYLGSQASCVVQRMTYHQLHLPDLCDLFSVGKSIDVDSIAEEGGNGSGNHCISLSGLNGQQQSNVPHSAVFLLSLMYAPKGSPLLDLANVLTRIESPSHILVWTERLITSPVDVCTVDLVELPRLRMVFKAREGRLYSLEHDGMFISNSRSKGVAKLVEGLPNSLILENEKGEFFVVVASASKPFRPEIHGRPFSGDILFNRGDASWLQGLGSNVRHLVYPVHISQGMFGTPTLFSALYLLLMRLMARQYGRAFRMLQNCISDLPLTPEEATAYNWLGSLDHDFHPDFVACRLKMSLLMIPCKDMVRLCPWNVEAQVEEYAARVKFVNAMCRLTIEEEMALLSSVVNEKGAGASLVIRNRFDLLKVLSDGSSGGDVGNAREVRAHQEVPVPPTMQDFDGFSDNSCLIVEEKRKGILRKVKHALLGGYQPHADIIGPGAIVMLNTWLNDGLELGSGKNRLGFPYYYSLLKQSVQLKILPEDDSVTWAATLLRFLPWKQIMRRDLLMSILRCLSYNPDVTPDAPPIVPKMSVDKLVDQVHAYLSGCRNSINWPRSHMSYIPPTSVSLPPLTNLQKVDKSWFSLRVPDSECTSRRLEPFSFGSLNLSAADVQAFASAPMAPIGLTAYVVQRTRMQQGKSRVNESLQFDVSNHPAAKAGVAATMLTRLKEDVSWFANKHNAATEDELVHFLDSNVRQYVSQPSSMGEAKAFLKQLLIKLKELIVRDLSFVVSARAALASAVRDATRSSEKETAIASLRWESGQDLVLNEEDLIALLICSHGEQIVSYLNQALDGPSHSVGRIGRQELFMIIVGLMMSSVRIAQAVECASLTRELLYLLHQLEEGSVSASGADLANKISQQSRSLTSALAKRRHYVVQNDGGNQKQNHFHFDPRLLAIEFSLSILLHKSQVDLIRTFVSSIASGHSLCHQMIMGAGKTTVVAPTLSLILAQSNNLVMEVVPDALLDFCYNIMRSTFTGGINKTIYTFHFDRFMDVEVSLLDKLSQAIQERAVLVTTPTSVKAFLLKFVELLHKLEAGRVESEEREDDRLGKTVIARKLRRAMNIRMRPKRRIGSNTDPYILQQQVEIAGNILKIFRRGTIMLDEVDLILHPLKSELNWPLGKRKPLDFTQSRPGSTLGNGVRWQIPFHLLDGFFYCKEGKKVIDLAFQDSRRAKAVLEGIKNAIEEGVRLKLIQERPHMVLLSRKFYHEHLQPLMAQWILQWMRKKSLRELSDEVILEYLLKGPEACSPAVCGRVKDELNDDQGRMLNLTHDWLNSFLPHILSKVDRVSFGLLSPQDLERALARDPRMPRGRKFLAVPFVGKDVPSRASEFSHPDVVIGLTILAYRYEGLRLSDFMVVMRGMLDDMEDEFGKYEMRTSCRTFIRWVTLAGGKVRGLREKIQAVMSERGEMNADRGDESGLAYKFLYQAGVHDSTTSASLSNGVHGSSDQQQQHVLTRFDESQYDEHNDFDDIWPLQLLELKDKQMVDRLFRLLRRLPQVIERYLNLHVFPDTMEHQGLKLAANGQDVGGKILFKTKLGFSGTPSDLLPRDFGKCQFQMGNTAMMLHYLTDPLVMSCHAVEAGWTPESILDNVAMGGYHALIDTGALVTGYTNEEVARCLLRKGLHGMDGVVFLDAKDRKMIVMRGGGSRAMEMSQVHIPPERRFTFYDQVHTTGMDIKQALSCMAVITISKDMTFRDYAQGAFRMRGIGKGQCLRTLIIPEVERLVQANSQNGSHHETVIPEQQRLCNLCAWLYINSMKSEKIQWNLLMEQQAQNVYRERAFQSLQHKARVFWEGPPDEAALIALDAFRERIDHSVETTIPSGKKFSEKINEMGIWAKSRNLLKDNSDDSVVLVQIEELVKESESQDPKLQLKHQRGRDGPPSDRLLKRPSVGSGEPVWARALYPYTAINPGDVNLAIGDKVEVLIQHEEGWWVGRSGGEKGTFPGSYVELISSEVNKNKKKGEWYDSGKCEGLGDPAEIARERAFESEQVQEQEQEQEQEEEQEQEKEEEVMEELEQDEYVKQAYSRADEEPHPWPITALSESDCLKLGNLLGFSPLSEFGVLTKLIERPKKMVFPPYQMFSRNHYSPAWFKTLRRIKNVIVLLDWVPNVSSLDGRPLLATTACHTVEQDACLKKGFGLMDLDGDGKLNEAEFKDFLCALDVDVDDPVRVVDSVRDVLSAINISLPVSLGQAGDVLRMRAHHLLQRSRHYSALSLLEAESFRGFLHMRQGQGLIPASPGTIACLRLTTGSIIDASDHFVPANSYQQDIANQCYRFMDSQTKYGVREGDMLIRGIQDNDRYLREAWFLDVRACRRRRQTPVDQTTVARAFTTPDEFHLLEYRATLLAVRKLLQAKRVATRDAFIAFNSSNSGALSCSELFGGLTWLGMRITPAGVHDIMRIIDLDCDGLASWTEFRKAFHDPYEVQDLDMAAGSWETLDTVGSEFTVPPRAMPELYELLSGAPENMRVEEIKPARIEAFKVKVKKQEKLDRVWSTHGSGARSKASIWSPNVGQKMVSKNKIRIPLGDYCKAGLYGFGRKDVDPFIVELTDTRTSRLKRGATLGILLEALFPHPKRFREVWRKEVGDHPLYVWRPVPHNSSFVALGLVATVSEEQPSLECVRCVHKRWAKVSEEDPVKIWDDSGTEGRGGSFWVRNTLHLMDVTPGHVPPTETCWDFKSSRFYLTQEEVDEITQESASHK